jgi:hypothetical protein
VGSVAFVPVHLRDLEPINTIGETMNFNKLLIVPFLAFAATACGNDCKSICEDTNDCPGVTTKKDCDDLCDKMETLNDDASCSDQYDDAMSCQADQDDQCKDSGTACEKEGTAWFACIMPYCMNAAHTAQCSAVGLDFTADGS